jgi:lipoprotein-releasing system ATP-binding protein
LNEIILKAENIHKDFGDLKVLKGVNLEVRTGEILTIVGKSGSGKSTLLHISGTLDRPNSGQIIIENEIVSKLSHSGLAAFRNLKIGFVFQFHHLLNEFTALENVLIPALIAGKNMKKSKVEALELLSLLQVENRISHKPNQMSGGEQQRIAIARALINRPLIVLADEPTGNLDSQTSAEFHELIFKLRDRFNLTFIIVTHNSELANMSDRTLTMKDGLLI